ncbi:hypothetical protein AB7C87_21920 [Natrarchaeobius sp. A-rgal3]|uniref:hypothetical protein n=1 Tax=Natrarchaeobius versutus TaxID=1679078 RepID=UPI00350FD2D3
MTKILSVAFHSWDSFIVNISIALTALLPGIFFGVVATTILINPAHVVEVLVFIVVALSVMILLLALINGIALRLHSDKEFPG